MLDDYDDEDKYMDDIKNKYISIIKRPRTYVDIANLKELSLSNCNLRKFPDNLSDSLEKICFTNNFIEELPEVWPKKLRLLYIGFNPIRHIPKNLPDTIKALSVSYCFISKISYKLPNSLIEFIASGNSISAIENLSDNLISLDLSCNHISEIKNIPENIENLNLTSNKIKDISMIGNYRKLEKLYLNSNLIENVNCDYSDCLKILNLGNNPINYISYIPYNLHYLNIAPIFGKQLTFSEEILLHAYQTYLGVSGFIKLSDGKTISIVEKYQWKEKVCSSLWIRSCRKLLENYDADTIKNHPNTYNYIITNTIYPNVELFTECMKCKKLFDPRDPHFNVRGEMGEYKRCCC